MCVAFVWRVCVSVARVQRVCGICACSTSACVRVAWVQRAFRLASSSLLSVSMLASSAGVKLCTATAPVPAAKAAASAAGSRQSGGGVTPSM
jgi:hypothetical protein